MGKMATAGDRDRDLSQDLKESGDWDDLSRGEKACLERGTIWTKTGRLDPAGLSMQRGK